MSSWHTINQFRYLYPAPVTGAVTRLRLLPRARHGGQRVVSTDLRIDPHPRRAGSWTDPFGNCVLEVEHPCLRSHLEVVAEFCTTAAPGESAETTLSSRAPIPVEDLAESHRLFLPMTRLADRSPEIESLAEALLRRCATDEALAWECMHRVYKRMRYLPGSTGVATPASAALAGRTGVCQDFAQVMLAICRTAGLPARYVSGHLEGEGQMHAWVEVLYAAAGGPPAWHPLDPTHDRAAMEGYVTVAVGRDYADVSPISGHCYGPAPGRLSCQQHTERARQEDLQRRKANHSPRGHPTQSTRRRHPINGDRTGAADVDGTTGGTVSGNWLSESRPDHVRCPGRCAVRAAVGGDGGENGEAAGGKPEHARE